MISLLGILAVVLPFNLSNFTGIGPFTMAFDPYIQLLGATFFFGYLIILVVACAYISSDSSSFFTGMIMIIALGIFMAILPVAVSLILFIISAFIITFLLYGAFVERRLRQ